MKPNVEIGSSLFKSGHGLATTATATAAACAHPTAWYHKREPTFSDAIAAVRRVLWSPPDLSMSRQSDNHVKIPTGLVKRFVETLCLAA